MLSIASSLTLPRSHTHTRTKLLSSVAALEGNAAFIFSRALKSHVLAVRQVQLTALTQCHVTHIISVLKLTCRLCFLRCIIRLLIRFSHRHTVCAQFQDKATLLRIHTTTCKLKSPLVKHVYPIKNTVVNTQAQALTPFCCNYVLTHVACVGGKALHSPFTPSSTSQLLPVVHPS